jgi:hypothetical protein
MRLPSRRLASWLVLGIFAFVLGQELVFLATFGSGYLFGLRETGHDAWWPIAVSAAILVAGVVAALAAYPTSSNPDRLDGLVRELEQGRDLARAARTDPTGPAHEPEGRPGPRMMDVEPD